MRVAIRGPVAGLLLFALAGCQPEGLLSLNPPPAPATSSLPAEAGSVPRNADTLVQGVLDDVNLARAKAGLTPLVLNDTLNDVADHYAERLISADFFAHIDPYTGATLVRRMSRKNYYFFKVGENLAAGQRDVAAVMKDWMDSPTHRANILDPDFTEMGLAVRDGGRLGRIWVQEFGRPLGQ